jgi:DNA-binding MarR family transcriptional regulator
LSKTDDLRRAAMVREELPEVGIGMLLRRADMAFNRLLRDKLAVHDITFSQFQHLLKLWAEDGLNQAELSRRIGIEKASSTTVLDALDQRGLIRRVRDAGDRRKINVFLTASGAALRPKLRAAAKLANTIARHGLSPAEVLTLFELVERVTNNIYRHDAAPGIDRRTTRTAANEPKPVTAN